MILKNIKLKREEPCKLLCYKINRYRHKINSYRLKINNLCKHCNKINSYGQQFSNLI